MEQAKLSMFKEVYSLTWDLFTNNCHFCWKFVGRFHTKIMQGCRWPYLDVAQCLKCLQMFVHCLQHLYKSNHYGSFLKFSVNCMQEIYLNLRATILPTPDHSVCYFLRTRKSVKIVSEHQALFISFHYLDIHCILICFATFMSSMTSESKSTSRVSKYMYQLYRLMVLLFRLT